MGRMVALMRRGLGNAEIQDTLARIERTGHTARRLPTRKQAVVEIHGDATDRLAGELRSWPGVAAVHVGDEGYPLAGRFLRDVRSEVRVRGVTVGGREVAVIAGPCSMEDPETLLETAAAVRACGASMLRVGLFKPRTSPYAFQGIGRDGIDSVLEARRRYGLPIVTEVLDARDIEDLLEAVDVFQVGARNMQNFPLLTELGKAGRPVLLKRGFGATVAEWLCAAEYLLANGNDEVILCERGIRTFEPSTRFTMDINAIPVAKEMTHLPVIIDPSHGTGDARFVRPIAGAGVAAGADGAIVEVHARPERALSDRHQTLDLAGFGSLMTQLQSVALAVGRGLAPPPPAPEPLLAAGTEPGQGR